MTSLAESLTAEQILYTENVAALKNGIALKYPHASSKERADLLAKAIKRILHKNLSSLEENIQASLIQELLKTAIQKQDFSINAYDVVSSYTTLDAVEESGITPLTTWLSETTGQAISPEEMLTTFSFPKPAYQVSPISVDSSESEPVSVSLDSSTTMVPSVSATSDISTVALSDSSLSISGDTDSMRTLFAPTSAFPYKKMIGIVSCVCVAASSILLITHLQSMPHENIQELPLNSPAPTQAAAEMPTAFLIPEESYLMAHLQYKLINETALKAWLIGRGSLLAEDPYFSTIIKAAASYNINPLLMFAITGQEQGFVPKDHKRALAIANNPFNVYGSWEDFNTDIEDTAFIAARTIINLSKGCPPEADPIKWLNKKYAEDPKWHEGVTAIFKQLEKIAGQESN